MMASLQQAKKTVLNQTEPLYYEGHEILYSNSCLSRENILR